MKEPLFPEFPREEYEDRVGRARSIMGELGLDALLLTQMENVRYISGYLSFLWGSKFRPLLAILPADPSVPPCLVLPGQEYGNSRSSWIEDVAFYSDQDDPVPVLVDALHQRALKGKRVGVELGYGTRLGMAQVQWQELSRTFDGDLVDSSPVMRSLRVIKSEREIEALRRACDISCIGVEEGWRALRAGMTEKELSSIMVAAMIREGADPLKTFFCINGGKMRYQAVNSPPTDYALQKGDMVMVDAGAGYKGYVTDFIRQAVLGPPTARQKECFELAMAANDAAIAAIRPGITCADVYDAGRKVLMDAGMGEYGVINIIGHGCGMELHELPYVGERGEVETSDTVLQKGMVFCIEPIIAGVDSPTWDEGVFIQEDMVAVTDDGHDVLTTGLSKDLWITDM